MARHPPPPQTSRPNYRKLLLILLSDTVAYRPENRLADMEEFKFLRPIVRVVAVQDHNQRTAR